MCLPSCRFPLDAGPDAPLLVSRPPCPTVVEPAAGQPVLIGIVDGSKPTWNLAIARPSTLGKGRAARPDAPRTGASAASLGNPNPPRQGLHDTGPCPD